MGDKRTKQDRRYILMQILTAIAQIVSAIAMIVSVIVLVKENKKT